MWDMPLVSIVMPCYNDGQYLRQAVDSCLRQTIEQIEIIIVNDDSDDRITIDALKALSDPRITVLHSDHIGPAGARNKAIQHACGKYILPLDADDWIDPEYIERAVEVLNTNPDIGIVYCHADLFGEKEGAWHLPEYSIDNFLLDNCIFITALFRKADWEAVGGFSTNFKYGLEDYDFWLSLIERGCGVYQFPETWFHYRIKKTSRTTQMVNSLSHTVSTYELLYHRHKELYMQHVDVFVLGLRRALVEQKMLNGCSTAQPTDPVAEYWQSIKLLKPKRARQIERLLALKDSLKGVRQWLGLR